MNPSATPGAAPQKSFSFRRVLSATMPVALAVIAVGVFCIWNLQQSVREAAEAAARRSFRLATPAQNRLDARFHDDDGDLVADPPAFNAPTLDPARLVFAPIGGEDALKQESVWREALAALAEATGKPVDFVAQTSNDEQLALLKEEKIHIALLNTGSVPAAVNTCGVAPWFTLGRADGAFGYTMQIVAPEDSPALKVTDLRGHKLMFTSVESNSGHKAPVVLLAEMGLYPERDYTWGFTFSHEESLRGTATGEFEFAAVASDVVARMKARGVIPPDSLKVVYESERFPPAALVGLCRLQPGLAEKIRATLANFSWEDTGLAREFEAQGVVKFVPVNYKNDWAVVRRIDDALGYVHAAAHAAAAK